MKYKYKTHTQFKKTRDEVLLEYCDGKKVLHIGATDSPYTEQKFSDNLLLHTKIQKKASELLGIDIDKDSIDFLCKKGVDNIIEFNMNNLKELNFEPEIIIFGETIEHLMNQEIALSILKKSMNKDTKLLVSTPNAMWLNKIIDTFKFQEIQHTDHKMIFSYATIKNLFETNGFVLDTLYFTFLNRKREGGTKFFKKCFCKIFMGFSETIVAVIKLA
ncbi:MAG: methyltransferase domain-containing protein [Bacteroidetes bacterium]|nr:methyltransferase domain-containing protein [Bacteroidota bacterium]